MAPGFTAWQTFSRAGQALHQRRFAVIRVTGNTYGNRFFHTTIENGMERARGIEPPLRFSHGANGFEDRGAPSTIALEHSYEQQLPLAPQLEQPLPSSKLEVIRNPVCAQST